jgi:hypothetical protein
MQKTLFFSISSLELYERLKHRLNTYLPGSFKFLGSTFEGDTVRDSDKRPVTRLLRKWAFMNERTERDYAAALCNGFDAVFVHEFGREAFLYAIKYEETGRSPTFRAEHHSAGIHQPSAKRSAIGRSRSEVF